MNRRMLSFLFAAIWIPALAMAQTPAASTPAAQTPTTIGPAKIAWINLDICLLTTDEGKGMYADIQKFVEEKQKEMDNMRKESDRLKSQLEVQGAKLNDEARAKLEEDIDDRDTKIQRFQQDTQKDIENRKTRMTNYLGKRMQPVVQKVAKEKGLSAILIFNQGRDAFVDQSLDVTEDLVKAYNQTYAAGTAKAPAAAAPAAAPAAKKP